MKQRSTVINGRAAIVVSELGDISLKDTFECGQAFRYEYLGNNDGFQEYMTVVNGRLIFVAQRTAGELVFFTDDEEFFERELKGYFTLERDYALIREDIMKRTDSEWLREAALAASGIAILKQDPWETLFSFIVSQNNNIPRIRKIIRRLSVEYGENLAITEGLDRCPLEKCEGVCPEVCKECGACYSFPTADAVVKEPERMLAANPGFRYRYLLCAAERVASGETDLDRIAAEGRYEYTLEELKRITGVGDKVASCVALFGFANLEAFPIDVWMKRAIDRYFGGKLDPATLGSYAGIAQQYIFHKLRNLEEGKTNG